MMDCAHTFVHSCCELVPGPSWASRVRTKARRKQRLQQVLDEPGTPALIFVHRDADSVDAAPRRREITDAAGDLGCAERVIPVVPVQELEAWLLTDEFAIRRVAGRPTGRTRLALPSVRNIEATARPKEILEKACLAAAEKSGARRSKEQRQFNVRRATLLERLDLDGPVTKLPSWQRFVDDLNEAAARVLDPAGS